MNRILWMLLMIFVISSCKKDKDEEPIAEPDLTPTILDRVNHIYLAHRNGITFDVFLVSKFPVEAYPAYQGLGWVYNRQYFEALYTTGGKVDQLNRDDREASAAYSYENSKLVKVVDTWGSNIQNVATSYYYANDLVDSISRQVGNPEQGRYYVHNMKFSYDIRKNLIRIKYYTTLTNQLFRVQEYEYGNEVNPLRKLTYNLLDFHCFIDEDYMFSSSLAPIPSFCNASLRLKKSKRIEYNNNQPYNESHYDYEYVTGKSGRVEKILRNGADYLSYTYLR